MAKKTDHNYALLAETDSQFSNLLKEIGNNRQQLFNKVLAAHTAIHRELSAGPINSAREKEIRMEVSRTVKMASHQLPKRGKPARQRPLP
jgi:hypothetical protein